MALHKELAECMLYVPAVRWQHLLIYVFPFYSAFPIANSLLVAIVSLQY